MPAITQTDIFNKAIQLLGSTERLLTSLDASPRAESMLTVWKTARPAALSLHPWNFALTRKQLARDTAPPEFEYAYRYKLPPDCLRWLPWDRGHSYAFEGVEEGGYLLTDAEEVFIRYIRDHDTISEWSPLFIEALAYQMAIEQAERITGGRRGLTGELMAAQDEILHQAKRVDGLATGDRVLRRQPGLSRTLRARRMPAGVREWG